MELNGKVALVTGSSQGIGQAIAVRLARDGANIVIDYRSHSEGAEETRRQVEAAGRGRRDEAAGGRGRLDIETGPAARARAIGSVCQSQGSMGARGARRRASGSGRAPCEPRGAASSRAPQPP